MGKVKWVTGFVSAINGFASSGVAEDARTPNSENAVEDPNAAGRMANEINESSVANGHSRARNFKLDSSFLTDVDRIMEGYFTSRDYQSLSISTRICTNIHDFSECYAQPCFAHE